MSGKYLVKFEIQKAALVIVALLLLLPGGAVGQERPAMPLGESAGGEQITVQGEAFGTLVPDTMELRVSTDGSGATAVAAASVNQKRQQAVLDALAKLAIPDLKISSEGMKYLGLENSETIGANATVYVKQLMLVESTALDKAPLIIDEALKAGATSVSTVAFAVRKDSPLKLALIAEATNRAKQKAEAVAKSAGAKLGALVNVVINEEPTIKLVRLREQRGEVETVPGAKDYQVTAVASYELVGQP